MKKILIIGLAIGLMACGNQKHKEEKAVEEPVADEVTFTDAQKKNAAIQLGGIEQKQISSVLKLNGKIDVPPQNIVSVSVPLGGYLKGTKLLPGMYVRQGEGIATVEDPQYIQLQQDYLTARARFTFLENEYIRQRDLNRSKAASDKVFQQAEADYNAQKVLINALAQRLKLVGIEPSRLNESNISRSVSIHAPINGYVSKVNVNIGKYVSPTEVLFELINPTDIHLSLMVFEKDLDKLFIGQKLVAYTNNEPGKKYNCEIILISRDLSADRAAEVHCHFEEYDKKLLPGMYMNALLQVTNNRTWALPEGAVVRFENKHYIFLAKGNKYTMTEVKTGESELGYIEILDAENLKGQDIVVKNAYSILMALKNKAEEE